MPLLRQPSGFEGLGAFRKCGSPDNLASRNRDHHPPTALHQPLEGLHPRGHPPGCGPSAKATRVRQFGAGNKLEVVREIGNPVKSLRAYGSNIARTVSTFSRDIARAVSRGREAPQKAEREYSYPRLSGAGGPASSCVAAAMQASKPG